MTADRQKVYDAIDKERAYHRLSGREREHQSPRKYMEILDFYAASPTDEDDAELMSRILRIAAVAVCAMEDNGVVPESR